MFRSSISVPPLSARVSSPPPNPAGSDPSHKPVLKPSLHPVPLTQRSHVQAVLILLARPKDEAAKRPPKHLQESPSALKKVLNCSKRRLPGRHLGLLLRQSPCLLIYLTCTLSPQNMPKLLNPPKPPSLLAAKWKL